MDWNTFYETYKPHKDPRSRDDMERRYETFSPDIDIVRSADPDCVWTMVEGDNGAWVLLSGYHHVNRVYYLITEKPFVPTEGQTVLAVVYDEGDEDEDEDDDEDDEEFEDDDPSRT